MTHKTADEPRQPVVLPVVRIEGTANFIDLTQRHFRETMNPRSHVDFDSVMGKRLCQQTGVVTCLRCGASVIVAAGLQEAPLRCVRCGTFIEQ